MGGPAPAIEWPDGHRFAFSIIDDTDGTTLRNGPPIYDALTTRGIFVTKTVWMDRSPAPSPIGGASCAEPDYLSWVLGLQRAGHEIGFHGARDHPSERAVTIDALDRFQQTFGHHPRVGADHGGNVEAMYWHHHRLSGLRSRAYQRTLHLARPGQPTSEGHLADSPYFWGDVHRDRIDYWRSFTHGDIDALRWCPSLPYHDQRRPLVNHWFTASHAPTLVPLVELLQPDRLQELTDRGGACIAYTHLGADVAPGGVVDPRFLTVLDDLAARPGWFAPVSTLLDHVRAQRPEQALSDQVRRRMERRWIGEHLRTRLGSETAKALRRRRARRSTPAGPQRP